MAERVLVSGGSRGLGLAFCEHFLERGGTVFACARSSTPEAEALGDRFLGGFHFAERDLSGAGVPAAVAAEATERLGGIDVLVNNAAAGQDGLLAHLPPEQLAALIHLNVTATVLLTRAVVRRMILQGGGVVLNVSSICAGKGYAGLSVYAATKAALEGFTRSLAVELGPAGIRVNAVAPGFFSSEMSAVLAEEQVERIRARTPTGRLATPADVVTACHALLHGNVSGQVLAVDGGASVA